MKPKWLEKLVAHVSQRPLVILRFDDDEWDDLKNSRRGVGDFTVARPHSLLRDIRFPAACLLLGTRQERDFSIVPEAYFGLLKSRGAITTLQTRMKITTAQRICPAVEDELLNLVTDKGLRTTFSSRLESKELIVRLSPALSSHLVEKLAAIDDNRHALRAVAESIDAPTRFSSNLALQEDAVGLALKTFGLSPGETAARVDVAEGRDTALARISVLEDAVIEHDARTVPGFVLAESDLTGRALFRKGVGMQTLEIITANKRPLEQALGVDLIYLNTLKENVVMVQYKMLDPHNKDWLYRPDAQLATEIARMKAFSTSHSPGTLEYRINPQVFYLRFVRRDATLGQSTATMPIDHFEVLRTDPACKGPKGAFRISYDTLQGRHLHQDGFLDLIQSGYIGAYAKTTADLTTLIDAILKGDRSVVAAVQGVLKHKY
ncbi:MAG: hypothetical protein ACRDGA_01740 [Bacteroidota bacterium]